MAQFHFPTNPPGSITQHKVIKVFAYFSCCGQNEARDVSDGEVGGAVMEQDKGWVGATGRKGSLRSWAVVTSADAQHKCKKKRADAIKCLYTGDYQLRELFSI